MRTIEEIIADSQKTSETTLREAFDAGRASAHTELKTRLSAFFADIMGPIEPHQPTPTVASEAHSEPVHVEPTHVEPEYHEHQHTDGEHHGSEQHGEGHYG